MLHKGKKKFGENNMEIWHEDSGSLSTLTTTCSYYQLLLQNPYLLLGYQMEINTPWVFHADSIPGPYLLDQTEV
jgi:hypothetical protein